MTEDEAIKRLIEMKQDIQEDINRVEDYVNTGADEEKVQAIEKLLDLYQQEKERRKIVESKNAKVTLVLSNVLNELYNDTISGAKTIEIKKLTEE